MRRSSLTECCVGFVFSSAGVLDERHERDVDIDDVLVLTRNWRIASRNGRDSMSPTVPPISEMTTSVSLASAIERIRLLISFVMCGITWTVEPRYSPFRSLRRTRSQIEPQLVCIPREVLVDESLVVPDVQVGLGAVLGDEDLAVLEQAHRPRVDVQVRVELLTCTLRPRASAAGRERQR